VLFFSVIGIAGYGAYKWLTDGNETAKLEGKKTIAIGDVTNYKRALKEYVKRK
jgi:hypothetical protein